MGTWLENQLNYAIKVEHLKQFAHMYVTEMSAHVLHIIYNTNQDNGNQTVNLTLRVMTNLRSGKVKHMTILW